MRYYFHTESHIRFTDPDGEELPDIAAARAVAARSIGELLRDDASIFWGSQPWSMTVTDGSGLIFFVIDIQGTNSPACPPK